MGLGLSGKWMTRISGAELPWHGETSFSGWQDEGWGSLVSSQDSKQKASEMRRAGWICQCLVPWGAQFRLTLTLHSQDKSLCHSSPSLPRHKFNLSSIIFREEPEYTRNHRWNGGETFFATVFFTMRILMQKNCLKKKQNKSISSFFYDTTQGGEEVISTISLCLSLSLSSHTHRHIHTSIKMMKDGVRGDVRALLSCRRCTQWQCVLSNHSNCQRAVLTSPAWLCLHLNPSELYATTAAHRTSCTH